MGSIISAFPQYAAKAKSKRENLRAMKLKLITGILWSLIRQKQIQKIFVYMSYVHMEIQKLKSRTRQSNLKTQPAPTVSRFGLKIVSLARCPHPDWDSPAAQT